ncbi:MAG: argininosuccinate lyase [Candidatus Humimicrobiaceae bacterium]
MKYLQEKAEKMDKIWSGRINGTSSKIADDFTFSLDVDIRLYVQDIMGSIAYAAGLKKIGIISKDELIKIINGLAEIKNKIDENKFDKSSYEDIHSLIEFELKNEIGEGAGKIHTGRSRNDQIVLDEKIYLKNAIISILESLTELELSIIKSAEKNIDVIFPAYTHMQKAQPVLFSHYLMSFFEKFYRDIYKLIQNFEDCDFLPLGSGACTGSGYEIDTKYLSFLLKFKDQGKNSMDEVSSRDYFQDFIYSLSCIMLHLSRFCEDLIIYNTNEFSFIELTDEFCTGSSIMPQKKNPDILELIRGKSAIVVGNLMQFEVLQKSLPTSYNRDLQEDKGIVFKAFSETLSSINIFKEIINNIKLNINNIDKNMKEDFLEATDIADYLVKKGETFRNAHNITGKLIRYCIEKKIGINELNIEFLKSQSQFFKDDIFDNINFEACINAKKTDCGTNKENVKNNLKSDLDKINKIKIKISELELRIPDINSLIKEIQNELD